ncbi:hypothetical protein Mapa_002190 [Marchantia paleacea]|nr:hypothetical protein Mapa_002190 [Marchantia paleacea]
MSVQRTRRLETVVRWIVTRSRDNDVEMLGLNYRRKKSSSRLKMMTDVQLNPFFRHHMNTPDLQVTGLTGFRSPVADMQGKRSILGGNWIAWADFLHNLCKILVVHNPVRQDITTFC